MCVKTHLLSRGLFIFYFMNKARYPFYYLLVYSNSWSSVSAVTNTTAESIEGIQT